MAITIIINFEVEPQYYLLSFVYCVVYIACRLAGRIPKTYTINADAKTIVYRAADNSVKMYSAEAASNGGTVRSNGNAREYNKV